MNYKKTIWYYLSLIVNLLVPNKLYLWLKKNPFKPFLIVFIIYLIDATYNNTAIFPLPCISIFNTNCILGESPNEPPFRGLY